MISIQARKLVKVSIIMIATRSIKIENVTVEQNTVAATMFGANTLQSVNTSDSGIPFAQYETTITVAGVTNLRFPGGTGTACHKTPRPVPRHPLPAICSFARFQLCFDPT